METRRLRFLVELSRSESMRAVAEDFGTTTSNVSQQIAILAREVRAALVEPVGRGIKLTSAGRRLAEHAVGILAAVEAARTDLDPEGAPVGAVRVAGFATAISRILLPVVAELALDHPGVDVRIAEHEPAESVGLLLRDEIDAALTYDYNLAPMAIDPSLSVQALWSTPWSLAVPAASPPPPAADAADAAGVLGTFRHVRWIANSRNQADEQVLRTLASMAGFAPEITHRADSLELVEELIIAGLGVGLLPADRATRPAVRLLPLTGPPVLMRAHLLTRRGQHTWAALGLLQRRIVAAGASQPGVTEGS